MPVDAQVPPLGPTQRLQALPKRRRARLAFRIILRIVHQHCDLAHPVRLLRACRKWPSRRATDKSDELSPSHSRTSLARPTDTSDKETPSDAAVARNGVEGDSEHSRARGNASRAISTRLAASSSWRTKMPVTLPPGRERLATYPLATGSKSMASNTIGLPSAANSA